MKVVRGNRPANSVLDNWQPDHGRFVDIAKRHVRLVLPNRNLLHDRATTQTIADVRDPVGFVLSFVLTCSPMKPMPQKSGQ